MTDSKYSFAQSFLLLTLQLYLLGSNLQTDATSCPPFPGVSLHLQLWGDQGPCGFTPRLPRGMASEELSEEFMGS